MNTYMGSTTTPMPVSWGAAGAADADVDTVLTVSWNGGGEAEAEAGIDTVVEKSSVECVDRELNGTKGVTCTPVADGTRLVGVGLKTMGDARVGSKLTGSKSNDSIGELLALVITSNALRSPGDNVSVAKNLTIYLLFIFFSGTLDLPPFAFRFLLAPNTDSSPGIVSSSCLTCHFPWSSRLFRTHPG